MFSALSRSTDAAVDTANTQGSFDLSAVTVGNSGGIVLLPPQHRAVFSPVSLLSDGSHYCTYVGRFGLQAGAVLVPVKCSTAVEHCFIQ